MLVGSLDSTARAACLQLGAMDARNKQPWPPSPALAVPNSSRVVPLVLLGCQALQVDEAILGERQSLLLLLLQRGRRRSGGTRRRRAALRPAGRAAPHPGLLACARPAPWPPAPPLTPVLARPLHPGPRRRQTAGRREARRRAGAAAPHPSQSRACHRHLLPCCWGVQEQPGDGRRAHELRAARRVHDCK